MAYDPNQQTSQSGGYQQQPNYPQQTGSQPMQQPNYPQQTGSQPMQQPGYPQQSGLQPMQQPVYPQPQPPQPVYVQQPPVVFIQPQPVFVKVKPLVLGVPFQAGARPNTPGFWANLKLPGQVCFISGIVVLVSFLLPWFNYEDRCDSSVFLGCVGFHPISESPNAFSVASGGGSYLLSAPFGFTLLWLAILAGIALLVLPILTAVGKLAARQGALFIVGAAGVALLCEIIYMFSAFGAVPGTGTHLDGFGRTITLSAGPGFGFWLGFLATLAAGGVYAYFIFIAKNPAMAGAPMGMQPPYAQPAAYPPPAQQSGSQPYPPPAQQSGSQPYPPPTQQYQPPDHYQQPGQSGSQPQYPGQYPGQQPPTQ